MQAAQIASAVYQSQGAKIGLNDALLKWGNTNEETADDLENFFTNLA
ncbi:phage tail assembly protein T [Xenorhabdus poinarii]|nr:DUF4035 domain-containing protein [Xenorhabdus poinarii]